jgi:hypothetical protein
MRTIASSGSFQTGMVKVQLAISIIAAAAIRDLPLACADSE